MTQTSHSEAKTLQGRNIPANEFEKVFWSRINVAADCWLWSRCKDHDGYGIITRNGKTQRAHRLAYELTFGPIDEGKLVCHRCDNTSCIKPAHLFLGTAGDNSIDMRAKHLLYTSRPYQKTSASLRGETANSSKLKESQVIEIRKLYADRSGEYSYPKLSKKFGVSITTVHRIVKRIVWKHI